MCKKLISLACTFLTIFILVGCSEQPQQVQPKTEEKQVNSLATNNVDKTSNTNKQETKTEVKAENKQEVVNTCSKTDKDKKQDVSGKDKLELIIVKQDLKQVDGGYEITCTVQSNRDYDLKNVVAEIMYYDKDVKTLGTSTIKTDIVKARDTWTFTIKMPSEYVNNFKSYRISKLTGNK